MTIEQHLLGKLAEECIEVSKVIFKIQQFGFDNFNPNDSLKRTNREKLEIELNHVVAAIDMLSEIGFEYKKNDMQIERKKELVKKYLSISKSLNLVT